MNFRTILAYAFGSFGTAVISFATLPLIAWFYSVEDIGKIAMLSIVSSFVVLIFSLGLDQAYVREYHETEKKEQLLKLVLIPGLFLISSVSISIAAYDLNIISNFIFGEHNLYLSFIALLFCLLNFLARFFSIILRMQERALAFSISQMLPKAFFLIIVLFFVLFDSPGDLNQLITAHIVSLFVVMAYYLFTTRDTLKSCILSSVTAKDFKPLMLFGLPLVFGGLASWGLSFSDKLFLRYFSNFAELGMYSVAISISSVVVVISGIFNTIWAPLVYKWISLGEVDNDKVETVSEHVLAAIYFSTITSCMFSWVVSYILPEQYLFVQYIIPACMLAPLLYTLTEVSSVGISISRKTSYLMYSSLIAMLINVILNVIFIPHFGAGGAAVSTVIAFQVFFFIRTEFSKRLWKPIKTKVFYTVILAIGLLCCLNPLLFKGSSTFILISFFYFVVGLFLFKRSISGFYLIIIRQFNVSSNVD